jgi:hypothetical protein
MYNGKEVNMPLSAEQYTTEIKERGAQIITSLKQMADLMRQHGDEVRAMDLDEAIGYVEGALDE